MLLEKRVDHIWGEIKGPDASSMDEKEVDVDDAGDPRSLVIVAEECTR